MTTFSLRRCKRAGQGRRPGEGQIAAAASEWRVAAAELRPLRRLLEDPKTGGIIAIYGGPGYYRPQLQAGCICDINMAEAPHPVGSSFKPYVLATAVNENMNV